MLDEWLQFHDIIMLQYNGIEQNSQNGGHPSTLAYVSVMVPIWYKLVSVNELHDQNHVTEIWHNLPLQTSHKEQKNCFYLVPMTHFEPGMQKFQEKFIYFHIIDRPTDTAYCAQKPHTTFIM